MPGSRRPPTRASRPIMLADGGITGPRAQDNRPAGVMEVPDKSVLIVRAGGAGIRDLTIQVPGEDGAPQRIEAPAPVNSWRCPGAEIRRQARGHDHRPQQRHAGGELDFHGHPRPRRPRSRMTKEPERSPRGSLKLFYKAEDDYGIVSAEARIRRLTPKADTSSTAWAREQKKGARPPYERPPALTLRLPRAYAKTAEGHQPARDRRPSLGGHAGRADADCQGSRRADRQERDDRDHAARAALQQAAGARRHRAAPQAGGGPARPAADRQGDRRAHPGA